MRKYLHTMQYTYMYVCELKSIFLMLTSSVGLYIIDITILRSIFPEFIDIISELTYTYEKR